MLARLLNACHHFPGFVYAAVRLVEATSTIEVDVRPRKRLRWYLEREPQAVTIVLQILLRVIEAHLRQGSGASAHARFGAVSFIHRFGASLNRHVHFHCCVSATRGRTCIYQGNQDPVFCHRYPTGPCVGGNPGVRSAWDTVASA